MVAEPAPCNDAFVVKLDPTGAVVWATYLGGAGDDAGQAIAVDAAGDVYIAGITAPGIGVSTNNFPTSTGSAFPASATSGDGFVVKLNAAGSQMMFGTYLPGIGTYVGYGYGRGDTVAMAIDPSGSVYVAGSIAPASFNFPTTAGAFQTSSNAQETGVVVKLNVAGALVYATYLGENSMGATTRVSAIAVDASGSAYLTGMAPDQFPTTAGAYEDISDGGPFVTKLNVAGSGEIYSTFVGGGNAGGLAIKLDSQGRAYVLGQVYCSPMCMINPTGFTTPGAFEPGGAQPPWAQPSAVAQFLVSLSADGSSLVYGTYITGALVLDVDASGDAFVAGYSGGGFPVSAGAFEQCYNANDFAAEFSPAGALIGATYFGAPTTAPLGAIAAGPNGLVTIASTAGNIVANFLIDNPQQQDGPCMSLLVENAANYSSSYPSVVAAGELVTLKGAGIGPATGAVPATSPYAIGLLPTELAGVQVFFDEIAAPLMYVQSDQINVVVPWEIAGRSSTQVHVIYNGASSNAVSLGVLPIAPGLFYLNAPGVLPSQGAILNADGSINTPTNCAHPGDEIALFGTGGGPTSPAGVTGGYSGLNANTLLTAFPVTVQIGGNAQVVYAGAAPGLVSGVFQINVFVPTFIQVPNPFASVSIDIGHQAANAVTMCIALP